MGGIRTGTRLTALQALERRIKHQIDSARARDDRAELVRLLTLRGKVEAEIRAAGGTPIPRPPGRPKTRRKKAEDRVTKRLDQLGVTARDVKLWAVQAGLLDAVHRGRISADLVEAYATAHPKLPTTRSA